MLLQQEGLQQKITLQQDQLKKQEEDIKQLSDLYAIKVNENVRAKLLEETQLLEINRLTELADVLQMDIDLLQQNGSPDLGISNSFTERKEMPVQVQEELNSIKELYNQALILIQEKETQIERLIVKNNIYQK